MTDKPAKPALLIEVLRDEVTGQTLVFTRTKHGADKVVKSLHHAGLSAEAIHGNKSQNQRERVLGSFRSGKLKVLVATDIAARGIDVDGISHVINYDLPNIPESYVHRIGRTARAGAEGIAISFCDNEERAFLRDIEKLIQIKLDVTDRRSNPHAPEQRPAKHHRPQQNAGRNGRNNGGQRRNGQPQRNGQQQRHGNPARQGSSSRQERQPDHGHRASTVPVNQGEIANVGFMRRNEPRRHEAGDANRNTR
jgi:superfamily II DNA/RNA helicase